MKSNKLFLSALWAVIGIVFGLTAVRREWILRPVHPSSPLRQYGPRMVMAFLGIIAVTVAVACFVEWMWIKKEESEKNRQEKFRPIMPKEIRAAIKVDMTPYQIGPRMFLWSERVGSVEIPYRELEVIKCLPDNYTNFDGVSMTSICETFVLYLSMKMHVDKKIQHFLMGQDEKPVLYTVDTSCNTFSRREVTSCSIDYERFAVVISTHSEQEVWTPREWDIR